MRLAGDKGVVLHLVRCEQEPLKRAQDPVLRSRAASRMSQDTPTLGVDNIRQHPRISLSGKVFWSSDRTEGWCDLLTLSSGGVGISPQRTVLKPRKGSLFSLTTSSTR